jgi:hypothetical protein
MDFFFLKKKFHPLDFLIVFIFYFYVFYRSFNIFFTEGTFVIGRTLTIFGSLGGTLSQLKVCGDLVNLVVV